jgi:uncharacterized protein (UPF0210 family)
MRIRSVTVFTALDPEKPEAALIQAGEVGSAVRSRLTTLGYEVQTIRAALPPIEQWAPDRTIEQLVQLAVAIDQAAEAARVDYISLGPLLTSAASDRRPLQALPAIIAQTERVFASAFIADTMGNVLPEAISHIAEVIVAVAEARPQGFGNLRFGAVANLPPGTPFFPAAYSTGSVVSFALGTEAADLALDACRAAFSTTDAMHRLGAIIEAHAGDLEWAMDAVGQESDAVFNGCDWSLAPHPEAARSVGAAIEALSGTTFGGWGTLTAVAALTRAIKRVQARRVGFSGVFLPVLEDAILGQRAAAGGYDLRSLLLFSAVCGSGLDTIPLPGDVPIEAIAALLCDVATLATVLDKPLTARLMPVPGLKAGETTAFDFPFLMNTAPLALEGSAEGLLRDQVLAMGL